MRLCALRSGRRVAFRCAVHEQIMSVNEELASGSDRTNQDYQQPPLVAAPIPVHRLGHSPLTPLPTKPMVLITATTRTPSSTGYSIRAAPSSSLARLFITLMASRITTSRL